MRSDAQERKQWNLSSYIFNLIITRYMNGYSVTYVVRGFQLNTKVEWSNTTHALCKENGILFQFDS